MDLFASLPPMSDHLISHWRLSEAALQARDFAGARRATERLLALAPDHALAWVRLSTIDSAQGRVRAATAAALRAAAVAPPDPAVRAAVAGRLLDVGLSRESHDLVRAMGDVPPAVAAECARLSSRLGEQDRALAFAERAHAAGMRTPPLLYLRATALLFCGRLDEAEQQLERCLAEAPQLHQAHWTLAKLRRWSAGRNHVARLRRVLAGLAPGHPGAAYVAYALFKELDDLGDHAAAWPALERGCAERHRALPYDRAAEDALVDALIARFDDPLLSPEAASPEGSAPIFVLGMPRSGSTLLERILGAHPQVADAGELFDFAHQLRWACDAQSRQVLDQRMVEAAPSLDFPALGRRYLAQTAWRAGDRPHYTDKLPANFLLIGFIHRALPHARILHATRMPMDTCFSNLKELFGTAYPHSYDQADMAHHYRNYRRLMDHWHARLPGRILDVGYEQLVAEPETVARKVAAFCGLDWDPACIAVERRSAPSSTASAVQVREPIHARFVSQWKHYAAQLEPLRVALGSLSG